VEVIRNITEGRFGVEGEVYFGLFEKFISLSVEDDSIAYAELCAAHLNSLSEKVILDLCRASIRYCHDFLENSGGHPKNFQHPKEVLPLIYPSVLIVPSPEDPALPVVHLELDCEWEEEHGMEWIVRGNEVLFVGAFHGVNPWSDFSEKKCWNYA
tara:strand:- start:2384 stop:2848 length:465 start_codon:yes stop_codon:yes gene_type:complete